LRVDINSEFRKCGETDFSNKGRAANQSESTIHVKTNFNKGEQ
jgi:hypothetical protein